MNKRHKRHKRIIHFLIVTIFIFITITINLFIHIKNIKSEENYVNKVLYLNNTKINFPNFQDERDVYIFDYLNKVDNDEFDLVDYEINGLDDFSIILFKYYKNDKIVDYSNLIFNDNKEPIDINYLIKDEDILMNKLKLSAMVQNKPLTDEILKNSKKSYLFKETELDVFLTGEEISIITINYIELDDQLSFSYKKDPKYIRMPEATDKTQDSPIIPPQEKEAKKLVAFTFDDGPSEYTTSILDVLDEFDAGATFYVVGYNVKVNQDIIRDTYDRGFELGNHTIDHSRLTSFSCEKSGDKLKENNDLIKDLIGVDFKTTRPTYGALNNEIMPCFINPIILWSLDPRDWESRDTESIVLEVLGNIEDGDIILFHDLYQSTLDAVKILLPILYDENYEVVSVSELFKRKNMPLEPGVVHKSAKKEELDDDA